MIKAILIDLEGVITSEGSLIKKKIHPLVKDEISYDELHSRYQRAKVSEISFDDFCKGLNKEKVLSFIDNELEREGIVPVLNELSKKYTIYLASNHIQPMGGYEVDKIGVRKYFKKLYFSSDLKIAKPDAKYFKKILDEEGLEGNKVIYIDDAKLNLQTAQKFGITTVWMNNNDNNIRNQIDFEPDYSVKEISNLIKIVDELNK